MNKSQKKALKAMVKLAWSIRCTKAVIANMYNASNVHGRVDTLLIDTFNVSVIKNNRRIRHTARVSKVSVNAMSQVINYSEA